MTAGRNKGQRIGAYYTRPKKKEPYFERNAWLREGRRDARVTIDELAAASGVSKRSIIRYEQGRYITRETERALRHGLAAGKK